MSGKILDITGNKYGRLTAVRVVGRDKWGAAIWELLCECGRTTTARVTHLRGGKIKSCGCLARETAREVARKNFLIHEKPMTNKERLNRQAAMAQDCYIRRLISSHSNLTASEIPSSLVEIQREKILNIRAIRKLKQEIKKQQEQEI